MMVGEMEVKERPRPSPDYLMQLLNEKKLMTSLPNLCGIFTHLERLLDEEITRVRKDMYNDTVNGLVEKHPLELPDAVGPIVHLQEKLFVPVKEYPDVDKREEEEREKGGRQSMKCVFPLTALIKATRQEMELAHLIFSLIGNKVYMMGDLDI
ncbi:hypothetical protein DNTS_020555 [Danionella cerebrum]|uniref:STAR protein homodimerisation region domain-containing protein n=1 Tax=Danionella cerebrum TaxID=2873325 RepID=A0A553RFA0_9TELE|nr:hypothetical protein DNTS_020555 [Danionella translucida]